MACGRSSSMVMSRRSEGHVCLSSEEDFIRELHPAVFHSGFYHALVSLSLPLAWLSLLLSLFFCFSWSLPDERLNEGRSHYHYRSRSYPEAFAAGCNYHFKTTRKCLFVKANSSYKTLHNSKDIASGLQFMWHRHPTGCPTTPPPPPR